MSLHFEPSELTPLRSSNNQLYNCQQDITPEHHSNQQLNHHPQHQPQHTDQFNLNHLQPTTSEYMSINNNNNPIDRSRVEINEPRSHQAFHSKPQTIIMNDTRHVLTRLIIDFTILLAVGLPILAFFLWGDPYKRGFFCDDESLKHPYHDSTVRNWMLYLTGLILPIGLITATEIIQAKLNKTATKLKLQLFGWNIPTWIENAYRQIGVFGFGAAVSQLTTDIAKYSIGRLRPHFFSVCQPVMNDGTNCSDPINFGRYIEDFHCLGNGDRLLKEMRLSFPSGHSSFSAYTMIYCAIYLQTRMTWQGSKLLKHLLQYLLIMMTWFTCMTRISNYKHHWSDVLAGASIGCVTALLVVNFVSDLGCRKARNNTHNGQLRYELATHTTTNGTVEA